MKLTVKLVFTILLSFSFSWSSHVYARSYVRYVTLADLNTKAVYADSVLTSIELPQGTPELGEYPQFNAAI